MKLAALLAKKGLAWQENASQVADSRTSYDAINNNNNDYGIKKANCGCGSGSNCSCLTEDEISTPQLGS